MPSVKLADTWRTTSFRLTLTYGLLFAASVIVLLTLIYYQTAHYMGQQIDSIINVEATAYSAAPTSLLPAMISEDTQRDARHINFYGLFNADKQLIAGNVANIPKHLPIDGQVHDLTITEASVGLGHTSHIHLLAKSLPNGMTLVIGRDETQITKIGHILLVALAGALLIMLTVTAIGIILSKRPIRRLQAIQAISEHIMRGDIHQRLPIAGLRDELDLLAQTTNRMLDSLEHMMHDVKAASDNIAHDLRTPLTRLRAVLYRAQHQSRNGQYDEALLNQAISETDALLARFRALMRIAEISSLSRRAGFEPLDIHAMLVQVHELFAPLAEEQSVTLQLLLSPPVTTKLTGDRGLLFEAVVNLVDNAIKFTAAGGHVSISLLQCLKGISIVIHDNGIGIASTDIQFVNQPFYRGQQAHELQLPGYGLGLNIVDAILRLHDFHLQLQSHGHGTDATIHLWSGDATHQAR